MDTQADSKTIRRLGRCQQNEGEYRCLTVSAQNIVIFMFCVSIHVSVHVFVCVCLSTIFLKRHHVVVSLRRVCMIGSVCVCVRVVVVVSVCEGTDHQRKVKALMIQER